MLAWHFDVGVSTNALLRAGVTVAGWRRVVLDGSLSSLDASLTALQMAATCDYGVDVMPTDLRCLGLHPA